jgi:cobyrinic acid a,c-diamide synthase
MSLKSFLISGTHCGVGKTTVSFILMSLFKQMGYQVQPFKHGPDFIDPGYHRLATGRNSVNLDFWMMGVEHIKESFKQHTINADIAIVEAMGALFDGEKGTGNGSAAQLASLLHLPIILVVDVYGMTRSINALLQGFLDFEPHTKIEGVIFNRAGGQKHYEMIFDSLLPRFRMLSLGYLPRFSHEMGIQERHLGLVTVEENERISHDSKVYLETALKTLQLHPLLEQIGPAIQHPVTNTPSALISPKKIRLGVAKDKAFCFYYQQNLNVLEQAGAELVYFSPIEDQALPLDLDGIYFGGGYPENFAKKLQDNISMKSQILNYSKEGMPIYAECGGLIYLSDKLIYEDGETYSMVGVFPHLVKWDKNYLAIRYVEIKTTQRSILGPSGLTIRGQEFHQTRLFNSSIEPDSCYDVTSSTAEHFFEGYQINNTLASYIHLYFPSASSIPSHFISQCKQYQQEKYAFKTDYDFRNKFECWENHSRGRTLSPLCQSRDQSRAL